MTLVRHARLRRLGAMLAPDRLAGQSLYVFGLKILNAGASFGLSLLVARAFGATGSGYFAICATTVTIVSYIALAGVDYSVLRVASGDLREGKQAEARGVVRAALRIVALLAPAIVVAMLLASDWLTGAALQQPGVAPLLGIMLLGVIPMALQRVASSSLRAAGRIFASQLIDGPLGTGFAFAGVATLLLFGNLDDLRLTGGFYVAGLTLGAVLGWTIFARTARAWPTAAPVKWLPLLASGLPILAINLSNIFTEWYTTVMLGRFWPADVVGHYRVAWQFVAIAGLVQVAMDTLVGPRIAAAARVGAKHEIVAVARKSVLLALLLGLPFFAVLMIFPERLLAIFGPEFVEGALTLQILAAGQLVRMASGPLGAIILMTGNQRWSITYTTASVICCVGLVALLVPQYGAVGAAIATTATVIVRNLIGGVIVARVLRINLFSRGG